jgi:2,3-bisphosphoglycerate-independent phosphoglycerate mutase
MNNPANMTRYWREYPHKVLQAFTLLAGKYGVVGDSRLGHSTIAAGRRLVQDYEKISASIEDKSFYKNKVFVDAIEHAKKNNSNIHLVGLLSNTGIHSHLNHLLALLDMAARENFERVFVDAISDGIDTGENDAVNFIEQIEQKFLRLNLAKFSSISGRFYAMDRDRDYQKTKKVYQALVLGDAPLVRDPLAALTASYKQGLNDFLVMPTLTGEKKNTISDNDAIIFFNFRSDRAIQLVQMMADPNFRLRFWRPKKLQNLYIATMTEYQADLPVKVAFPQPNVKNILPGVLSYYHKTQLRVAETEKTAHVTNFFNCGANVFPGEERVIVSSKRVKKWDEAPEMSAQKITKVLVSAIERQKYDFILANYANVDMMAHTGNFTAAGVAVRKVDEEIGKVVAANLKAGGATIITADHGNVEQIVKFKPKQDPENKHTLNPVPFILINSENRKDLIRGALISSPQQLSKLIEVKASLADVAPTVLELMGLPKPAEMTGKSLLRNLE